MKQKSLAKNSVFFVFYRLLNVIFPLITVTYVSKVILATGVGKVASAQNIVQYFVIIAALGIPNYGTRECAKVKEDKAKLSKLFSELFTINSISTLLCTIAYYVAINVLEFGTTERVLYNIVGITIILNFFNVDWFYQGNEQYSYIAIRSFVIKVLSMLTLFVFVRKPADYVIYALIYLLGIAGNNLINFFNLRRFGIKLVVKDLDIVKHLKPVSIFLCTTIAIELYTMVDTTMLTFLCSEEIVGYYANSMKIVKIVIMLVAAIGGVLLPRLSYYQSKGMIKECENIVNKIFAIIFFLFIPCAMGLFLTADSLVPILFGNSFMGAITTLKIASFLIYALGFSNLFGTQVLLTFDDEKKLLLATVLGAVTNISLNALLIPSLQQNGAALASIASETIVTLATFFFARKHLNIRLNLKFVLKTIVACVVMMAVVIALNTILGNGGVFLVVAVLLGALAYFCVSLILKNEVIKELVTIVKKH
ncbi:MAG: flippase, partial [Erysipelotrichaceae bacterium]|nr:flippase [Erysipelotrichaceae bacterium]